MEIKSDFNFNNGDGIKIFIPEMEKYDKCTSILDEHNVPYHTYTSEARKIWAIFEGIVEDISTEDITEKIQE
ncbi:hypothetical protein JTB14_002795 [Gonioctena quinquepunctata]|nr:hypothetical protein JTB14_002795 [Gonioctena quinquepunctata]